MEIRSVVNKLEEGHRKIASKVLDQQRISPEEGLILYEEFDLGMLGMLAGYSRHTFSGDHVYFNRNVHLEPTNICIHNCLFCSYSRKVGEEDAWEYSLEDIRKLCRSHAEKSITEIHIVGGVHPLRDVHYYAKMLEIVREELPGVHIKAFTAAEIDHMAKKAKLSIGKALDILKKAGLESMPGGGAEIFDEGIRQRICPDKTGSEDWLTIHRLAHEAGIPSNCTMLYGHVENYEHRIDHMNRLRALQDKTAGFNAFIPLKYKSSNNQLSAGGEVSAVEDLKNYAVSRLFLDNIPHLKAYWPMTGKSLASLSLSFGVDDLDGTIQDSTRIYSMAGADEKNPDMPLEELLEMIRKAGRIPVERNSIYDKLKIYSG